MNNKVVLVTGGSKGIGREIARLYHNQGAVVYICARDQKRLEQTVEELDPTHTRTFGLPADISQVEDCKRVMDTIVSEQGRLDILVNNAGMAMRGTVLETAPTVMRSMVEINLLGAAYLSHFALPHLLASRGSIHFTSSLAGLHGLPKVGMYSASKGALTYLAESLRAEVSSQGVQVGITYVGFTENDPDKVVYAADGKLVGLSPRKNSQTQAETAQAIVGAIARRKPVSVLTNVGKISAAAYRFFPRLTGYLIGKFASHSKQYAQQGGAENR